MLSCLVYFGTSEGQTRKIAEHLAQRLRTRGLAVEVAQSPADADPSRFDGVIVGDSIHIGRYHRSVLKFIRRQRAVLEQRPCAFFSVCLSIASKNEEDRAHARRFIDDMAAHTGWHPERVAVFAGALQYTQYGLLTRMIMKRISAAEGQGTDTRRDYEYTDWASVDAFADGFAEQVARARGVALDTAPAASG